MDYIQEHCEHNALTAGGDRVVHGGPKYYKPERITAEMIEELRRLKSFDPEHLPEEILLIEAFHRRFPHLTQIARFDAGPGHSGQVPEKKVHTENKKDPKSENKTSDLNPQIAKRAYELYEQRAKQDGHADQDGREAEKEIEKDRPHKGAYPTIQNICFSCLFLPYFETASWSTSSSTSCEAVSKSDKKSNKNQTFE